MCNGVLLIEVARIWVDSECDLLLVICLLLLVCDISKNYGAGLNSSLLDKWLFSVLEN